MVANPLTNAANYKTFVETYMNIDSFIDYVLLETFMSNCDWVTNNVWMWRNRDRSSPLSRWTFIAWDLEYSISQFPPTDNQFSSTACSWRPNLDSAAAFNSGSDESWIFASSWTALKGSAEFRLRFADRYQKHFFNGGAMTKQHWIDAYDRAYAQANTVVKAIYGSDLTRSQFDTFIATRHNNYVNQLTARSLWFTSVSAPTISPFGGVFPTATTVTLTATNPSTAEVRSPPALSLPLSD